MCACVLFFLHLKQCKDPDSLQTNLLLCPSKSLISSYLFCSLCVYVYIYRYPSTGEWKALLLFFKISNTRYKPNQALYLSSRCFVCPYFRLLLGHTAVSVSFRVFFCLYQGSFFTVQRYSVPKLCISWCQLSTYALNWGHPSITWILCCTGIIGWVVKTMAVAFSNYCMRE